MLDLRFVIGGAPRAVEPNSLLVLDAKTLDDREQHDGARADGSLPVVRGAGLVWTVDGANNRLRGTNPESGRVVRDEVVGTDPVAVAIGFGAAWVANAGNGIDHPCAADEREDRDDRPGRPARPAIATGVGLRLGGEQAERQGDPRSTRRPKQVDKTLRLANPPLAVARARRPCRARDRRLEPVENVTRCRHG